VRHMIAHGDSLASRLRDINIELGVQRDTAVTQWDGHTKQHLADALFDQLDVNRDGVLDRAEFEKFQQEYLQLSPDARTTPKVQSNAQSNKTAARTTSPKRLLSLSSGSWTNRR